MWSLRGVLGIDIQNFALRVWLKYDNWMLVSCRDRTWPTMLWYVRITVGFNRVFFHRNNQFCRPFFQIDWLSISNLVARYVVDFVAFRLLMIKQFSPYAMLVVHCRSRMSRNSHCSPSNRLCDHLGYLYQYVVSGKVKSNFNSFSTNSIPHNIRQQTLCYLLLRR